ncbi:hypothetical protein [Hymenobacter sp. UYCo722]|uniref:hypothetical protein n=1 Tax=Hymenobacter sp. UYCo722 TaxID=3156335 RepID=UPI003398CF85
MAIDIITTLKGLDFADAHAQATDTVVERLTVRLIHYQHLLQAKRAAGCPRDHNDLEKLQRFKPKTAGPRNARAGRFLIHPPANYCG